MNGQVLLVEDDYSLRESTAMLLEEAGMTVTAVSDGQEAIARFRSDPFDLILLDIMLPTLDGLDVCRTVRSYSNVPLIMLTAKAQPSDLIVGLELGADDYVTKPFVPSALLARIKALLRRASNDFFSSTISTGSLVIDPVAFVATKAGAPLDLSATEFKLLVELARHPNQAMTRESLLKRVWNYDYMGDSRLVDMAIQRLRSKLDGDQTEPPLIATVRGVGYRFEPNE